MTLSDFTQLVLALTGLTGAIVGGFGAWVAYRSHRNIYRERLYERRLSSYAELTAAAAKCHDAASTLLYTEIADYKFFRTPTVDTLLLAGESLWAKVGEHTMFLSDDLNRTIAEFMTVITAVGDLYKPPRGTDAEERAEQVSDAADQLHESYRKIHRAVRNDLGFPQLTEETRKLIIGRR